MQFFKDQFSSHLIKETNPLKKISHSLGHEHKREIANTDMHIDTCTGISTSTHSQIHLTHTNTYTDSHEDTHVQRHKDT